jgi:type II secretory pathway component GspD/PulD (secretin)
MSLGVDTRNNALVVSAPQPLFAEVEMLVKSLDQIDEDSTETVRVVTLKRANSQSIHEALKAITGDSVKTTNQPTSSSGNASGQSGDRRSGDDAERMRQRMEFFRGGGGGGGGGGRGGRGGRGGGGQRGGGSGR